MLGRAWKLILLILTLILVVWPDLLGVYTNWIVIIALVILLLGEFCQSSGGSKGYRIGSSGRRRVARKLRRR